MRVTSVSNLPIEGEIVIVEEARQEIVTEEAEAARVNHATIESAPLATNVTEMREKKSGQEAPHANVIQMEMEKNEVMMIVNPKIKEKMILLAETPLLEVTETEEEEMTHLLVPLLAGREDEREILSSGNENCVDW
jgi:hypothetical protein